MPTFNMFAPRTGTWGPQLERAYHPPRLRATAKEGFTDLTHSKPQYSIGNAINTAYGMSRRYGQWYYPSETIRVRARPKYMPRSYTTTTTTKKKKRTKKTCCRYIKGKKVCRPEYCSKNKKSWY